MIFFERTDADGTYFINESGEVYREGELIFAYFLARVASGEWTIQPYAGSALEATDTANNQTRLESIERNWRDTELQKSDLELLKELEKQFPALEAKRNALRDYPQSADFLVNRPVV